MRGRRLNACESVKSDLSCLFFFFILPRFFFSSVARFHWRTRVILLVMNKREKLYDERKHDEVDTKRKRERERNRHKAYRVQCRDGIGNVYWTLQMLVILDICSACTSVCTEIVIYGVVNALTHMNLIISEHFLVRASYLKICKI